MAATATTSQHPWRANDAFCYQGQGGRTRQNTNNSSSDAGSLSESPSMRLGASFRSGVHHTAPRVSAGTTPSLPLSLPARPIAPLPTNRNVAPYSPIQPSLSTGGVGLGIFTIPSQGEIHPRSTSSSYGRNDYDHHATEKPLNHDDYTVRLDCDYFSPSEMIEAIILDTLLYSGDVAAIEIAQDADRRRPCHVLVTFCFSEIAQSILKAAKIICIGGFQFHTSPSSVPAKPASRNQILVHPQLPARPSFLPGPALNFAAPKVQLPPVIGTGGYNPQSSASPDPYSPTLSSMTCHSRALASAPNSVLGPHSYITPQLPAGTVFQPAAPLRQRRAVDNQHDSPDSPIEKIFRPPQFTPMLGGGVASPQVVKKPKLSELLRQRAALEEASFFGRTKRKLPPGVAIKPVADASNKRARVHSANDSEGTIAANDSPLVIAQLKNRSTRSGSDASVKARLTTSGISPRRNTLPSIKFGETASSANQVLAPAPSTNLQLSLQVDTAGRAVLRPAADITHNVVSASPGPDVPNEGVGPYWLTVAAHRFGLDAPTIVNTLTHNTARIAYVPHALPGQFQSVNPARVYHNLTTVSNEDRAQTLPRANVPSYLPPIGVPFPRELLLSVEMQSPSVASEVGSDIGHAIADLFEGTPPEAFVCHGACCAGGNVYQEDEAGYMPDSDADTEPLPMSDDGYASDYATESVISDGTIGSYYTEEASFHSDDAYFSSPEIFVAPVAQGVQEIQESVFGTPAPFPIREHMTTGDVLNCVSARLVEWIDTMYGRDDVDAETLARFEDAERVDWIGTIDMDAY